MHEEYEKEFKLIERTDEEFDIQLVKSIIKTKQDLENANRNFEFAEDELVDYYLYQIKANILTKLLIRNIAIYYYFIYNKRWAACYKQNLS